MALVGPQVQDQDQDSPQERRHAFLTAAPKHSYEVARKISDGCYLVRRKKDGELFLGQPVLDEAWSARDGGLLHKLVSRGAGGPVGGLLNHENIVSVAARVDDLVFDGQGGAGGEQHLLLWDFCDRGTLGTLITQPPVRYTATGFLPESLCWHVAISMLKALVWLHHGHRERTVAEEYALRGALPDKGDPPTLHRADDDWLPVLHRNITPQNIWFQAARGGETYGLCKLGDFSSAFVSGHASKAATGRIVTARTGDPPAETARQRLYSDDKQGLPRSQQPYTDGTELWHLGHVLYTMMSGRLLPHEPEECGRCRCRHMRTGAASECGARHEADTQLMMQAVDPLSDYSFGMQWLVVCLLMGYREKKNQWGALDALEAARAGYADWRAQDPEGALYVSHEDEERRRLERAIADEKAGRKPASAVRSKSG